MINVLLKEQGGMYHWLNVLESWISFVPSPQRLCRQKLLTILKPYQAFKVVCYCLLFFFFFLVIYSGSVSPSLWPTVQCQTLLLLQWSTCTSRPGGAVWAGIKPGSGSTTSASWYTLSLLLWFDFFFFHTGDEISKTEWHDDGKVIMVKTFSYFFSPVLMLLNPSKKWKVGGKRFGLLTVILKL